MRDRRGPAWCWLAVLLAGAAASHRDLAAPDRSGRGQGGRPADPPQRPEGCGPDTAGEPARHAVADAVSDAARSADRRPRAGRRGAEIRPGQGAGGAAPGHRRRGPCVADGGAEQGGRPAVTDEAVHARYDQEIAGKPGEEEVHARHILVDGRGRGEEDHRPNSKSGGDFAALAKQYSKDPGGGAAGRRPRLLQEGEMVPEFATAAFALQPGQVSPEAGAQPVRLARDPGGGAPPRRAAELRSGARRTAPEDDPGRRAEGGGEGARRRVGGEIQSGWFAGAGDRHRRTAARAQPSNSHPAPNSGGNAMATPSLRLPFRCRNCRRSPACVLAPRRPASATRGERTW